MVSQIPQWLSIIAAIAAAIVSVVTIVITIWRFGRIELGQRLGQERLRDLQVSLTEQQVQLNKAISDHQASISKLQAKESSARAEHTLNVTVDVDVIECDVAGTKTWILQTNVDVVNGGRDSVCIPAVYVHARSLIEPNKLGANEAKFYNSRFDNLPECDGLSIPHNVARLDNSIHQLAPGEIEHFVRWDCLGETFVSKYPVIVVSVDVFGASYDLLGHWAKPKHGTGIKRGEWLDYMNGTDRKKETLHQAVVFARASESNDFSRVAKGDRVLLDPATMALDGPHTVQFREVLHGVFEWNRQRTVALRSYLKKADDAGAVITRHATESSSAGIHTRSLETKKHE
jgi:hypothetical protein